MKYIIRNKGNEEGCLITEVRGGRARKGKTKAKGDGGQGRRLRYGKMQKITRDRRDREDLSGKLKIGV